MDSSGEEPTSRRLLVEHEALWQSAYSHPLIVGAATGTLPDGVFARFLVHNNYFLRGYRRFMMVMGMQAPNSRTSALIFSATRNIDRDLVQSERFLRAAGVETRENPTPRDMDYSSFCVAHAANGWPFGLTVLFAIERVFVDAWTHAATTIPLSSPIRPVVDTWITPVEPDFLVKISRLVDELPYSVEMSRIFGQAMTQEIDVWSEAMQAAHPA